MSGTLIVIKICKRRIFVDRLRVCEIRRKILPLTKDLPLVVTGVILDNETLT